MARIDDILKSTNDNYKNDIQYRKFVDALRILASHEELFEVAECTDPNVSEDVHMVSFIMGKVEIEYDDFFNFKELLNKFDACFMDTTKNGRILITGFVRIYS